MKLDIIKYMLAQWRWRGGNHPIQNSLYTNFHGNLANIKPKKSVSVPWNTNFKWSLMLKILRPRRVLLPMKKNEAKVQT